MQPRRPTTSGALIDRYRIPLIVALLAIAAIVLALLIRQGGTDADKAEPLVIVTSTSSTSAPTTTEAAATSTSLADSGDDTSVDSDSILGSWRVGLLDINAEYTKTLDPDGVSGRPVPGDGAATPIPATPPRWAKSTKIDAGGYLSTDVGCADSPAGVDIDRFLSGRVGPVLGWDYQHVYPIAEGKYLWLFQDVFLDHSGSITNLTDARFIHNAAMVQTGACFQLLHQGTTSNPKPFEAGDGTGSTGTRWWWPMGGEIVDEQLHVFWVEMVKDPVDPAPPDGLGWHPVNTYLASYNAKTLGRATFSLATDSGVDPIFGYAVDSDNEYTYLFGNSFEQNMTREGGFWSGPHSGIHMWLARVPLGQMRAPLEYHTPYGWSYERAEAAPIVSRFYAENPMQPRYLNGQWISATAVDGYWGDDIAIDVANQPWGPWSTVSYGRLLPRGGDPLMNTYHAHVLPYFDTDGSVLIAVSNNARNMLRDAYPKPSRYRPQLYATAMTPPPPQPSESTVPATSTTTTTTTLPPTTVPTTTLAPTTPPPTTTVPPTTTTTSPPTTTTTSTTTTTTTTVPTTTSSTTP